MPQKRQYANWLIEFCNLFKNTKVTEEYALWAGIWTLGSVLQDNVYFPWGSGALWPNIYCWLIGPPASGKSTAAEIGYDMIRDLKAIDNFSGEISRSRLISRLTAISQKRSVQSTGLITRPCLAMFSDELGISIGSGENAADFLRLLTTLYQGVYQSDTHIHGTRNLEDKVVISWLACTTVPWLRRSVPADLIDSGTIARLISVVGKLSGKVFPRIQFDNDKRRRLLTDLAEISFLRGEYYLSSTAELLHTRWHAQIEKDRSAIQDAIVQGIYGREDEHAIKVAMCLTASTSENFEIPERVLMTAIDLVVKARNSSTDLFRRLAVGDKTIDMKEYLLSKILTNGEIQHSMLLRSTASTIPSARMFHELISSLYAEGAIGIVKRNGATFYTPISA